MCAMFMVHVHVVCGDATPLLSLEKATLLWRKQQTAQSKLPTYKPSHNQTVCDIVLKSDLVADLLSSVDLASSVDLLRGAMSSMSSMSSCVLISF